MSYQCKHYRTAESECGVCYPCITTSLRAEVERLKAALERVRWSIAHGHNLGGSPLVNAHWADTRRIMLAALDGSSPAPRMYTEEQVRDAWKRAWRDGDGNALSADDILKALLESQ
jgi:hypothetical protein